MGFKYLVRDQEVDGSNPFAPTILLESATYSTRKSKERLVASQAVNGSGRRGHVHSFPSEINALRFVLGWDFYFLCTDNTDNICALAWKFEVPYLAILRRNSTSLGPYKL